MNSIRVGLFKGRHDLPVEEYIFKYNYHPLDFQRFEREARDFFEEKARVEPLIDVVYIYVTGLTAGLISAIEQCMILLPKAELNLMHYDRESDSYRVQCMKSKYVPYIIGSDTI